jgi:serine/threonine protein kinase
MKLERVTRCHDGNRADNYVADASAKGRAREEIPMHAAGASTMVAGALNGRTNVANGASTRAIGDSTEAAVDSPGRASDVVTSLRVREPERYVIVGEHGRGGLGKVTRARDKELGRDVAIKELLSRSDVAESRFLREALVTAGLEHPGIVPIHEAGRWPDGTPFYVMKLVSGRSLKELLAERPTIDERLELLHHVIAVADAVAYAHGRNIIHRDLKPANVIIGDFGETVVIDWGLAKDLMTAEEPSTDAPHRSAALSDLTKTGSVLGTPLYMSPEQWRGESVDQRTDVFAIGALLWELTSLDRVPPTDPRQRRKSR